MIRFAISDANLYANIDAIASTWRTRAEKRTDEIESGIRTNITGMWSQIKKVYMDLQGPKCAFCEKWVEGQPVERDVEHFRPKNRIKQWRVPTTLRGEAIAVSQPTNGTEAGYRLLAYAPLNYVAACKTCNSVLKRDHFPIAGLRDSTSRNPRSLAGEQAYLIFPLGDLDDDPEDLIEFHGISPQPKCTGFRRKRALVTIVLFQLDDTRKRLDLLVDRAEFIEKLYFALRERDRVGNSADDVSAAKLAIVRLTSPRSRHTNCLRSYVRVWETNRPDATTIYEFVRTFLQSKSPR